MDAVGKDGRVSVVSSLSSPIPAFSTIFFPWQFRNIAQIRAHDFYKIVSNTNGQAAQSKKCSNSLTIQLCHMYHFFCFSWCQNFSLMIFKINYHPVLILFEQIFSLIFLCLWVSFYVSVDITKKSDTFFLKFLTESLLLRLS